MQLQVLFAWTYGHHLHIFVICSPFQINATHYSSKYSPSHFSCYSYHGIFNSYHFHQQKTKPNSFYVGVWCLASCCNNNIVNRLKQEALFQAPFDIGTHDLTMQELFLKNLMKQANLWKLHQKTFHIRAFFKMNNNQLIDLGQSKFMRCIFFVIVRFHSINIGINLSFFFLAHILILMWIIEVFFFTIVLYFGFQIFCVIVLVE